MCSLGSGTRRILHVTYQLSGMLCIRKLLAAIWAVLERQYFCPKATQEMHKRARGHKLHKSYKKKEPPTPTPTPSPPAPPPARPPCPTPKCSPGKKSDQDWLILLTSGLDEMRAISSSKEGTHQQVLALVLDCIGLLGFLTDVWRWQEVDVCQAFVLHWDHRSKTTRALGVHIDASYGSFLSVTGLAVGGGKQGDQGSSSQDMRGGEVSKAKNSKKRAVDYVEDLETKPISYLLLNDPVLQSLLLVLNRTLWFTKKQVHCPTKDMVYLLVESLKGKKLDWSKSVYEKFISEMRELQDRHENNPQEKLQTLSGPLICFLYSQAKRKAHAMKENVDLTSKADGKKRLSSPRKERERGRGVLKEKDLYDYYDDGEVVPPGFLSENLKLPFPPSIMPRKQWHVNSGQPRTALNLIPAPELPSKTNAELQAELEEEFSKIMASQGYHVSEEMKDELNKTFHEQRVRQERFKHHLRSSWQRPCVSCTFGCCHKPPFTSKDNSSK